MAIPFNSVAVKFKGAVDASATTFKVRSHSEAGNDRPDIDVTGTGDTRRVVLPGFAAVEKHTFEVVLDDQTDRTKFGTWVAECAAGDLTVEVTFCGDASATALLTRKAWLTGFTYSGDLDGVMTASIEFTVDHTPA